jgi:hypothetical protein
MKARIATRLPCSEAELWDRIVEPESLRFVAAPILEFVPVEGSDLPEKWRTGVPYPLRLRFLGVVPLGRHTIELVRVDERARRIESRESGLLARTWNHVIQFSEVEPGTVDYVDEIEIRAGLLTPVIWAFAHLFYRHRQRRWRVLLSRARPR